MVSSVGLTHFKDQIPLILQEASIPSLLRNILWAAEVYVYGIAVRLKNLCRCQQLFRIVGAELDDEWSVAGATFFTEGGIERELTVWFSIIHGEHLAVTKS